MKRTEVLKPGEIIPMTFDYVFTNILNNENNIDILENFLAIYFDVDVKDIKGHITLKNRGLPTDNKKERDKQVDIVLDLDDKKINIELNNNSSKDILKRNIVYASKVHGSQLKYKDNDYSKIGDTIQINFNNFRCNKDEIKEEYYFRNKRGEVLNESFRIDLVDIDLSKEKRNNKYESKLARLCRVIATMNKADLIKELGDDLMEKEVQDKLVDTLDTYSQDEEVIALYSKYSKEELERKKLINEAKRDGIEQGKVEGINQRNIEIAKKMLKENEKIDKIILYTNLTVKEIEDLK